MKRITLIVAMMVIMNVSIVSTAFGASDKFQSNLMSEAAIMIDSETGEVLYEKNASKKMYPASLTKIATAIYAIETGNLDDVVTVSENARNTVGTKVYLEEGEQVTLKKLLQGLLINSGNDAGVAIAEHLSGSVERFSTEINQYLKNVVGVKNTNFVNPHGLFDAQHVTTAEDLAKITQYAMKNEVFREIFGTKKLKWNGESWDTTLYTHHKLMRQNPYKGVTGGKTGFVNQSGFTLATTAERENISLIVITLNSNFQRGAYKDTTKLLDYGFRSFQTSTISEGTTFIVDGVKYKVPEKLSFTKPLNRKVTKEVKNGKLKVIDQKNGSVLTSLKLDKVEPKKEKVMKEQDSASKNVDAVGVVLGNLPRVVSFLGKTLHTPLLLNTLSF
ncbi:D-alanyl-D-alanine carboxypeptidase family protein [Halobacillus amylolyticus]|uniref:D-alanyl-D-alanine carboxypeptidase n=1 Tax=Halobacillus amylolyticus TaxID=2932259 RepID=A0ABY4HI97_9BACI|nr:D-alanyl-D-alanine carboxypeptidase family protein [Halobacillus amylolyticus]UOR14112.1 D-alanyl-D-alanine carboxypeptidase [Halobacillus amylolyticus]